MTAGTCPEQREPGGSWSQQTRLLTPRCYNRSPSQGHTWLGMGPPPQDRQTRTATGAFLASVQRQSPGITRKARRWPQAGVGWQERQRWPRHTGFTSCGALLGLQPELLVTGHVAHTGPQAKLGCGEPRKVLQPHGWGIWGMSPAAHIFSGLPGVLWIVTQAGLPLCLPATLHALNSHRPAATPSEPVFTSEGPPVNTDERCLVQLTSDSTARPPPGLFFKLEHPICSLYCDITK